MLLWCSLALPLSAAPELEAACYRLLQQEHLRSLLVVRVPAQLLRFAEHDHRCINRSELRISVEQNHRRLLELTRAHSLNLQQVETLPEPDQAYILQEWLPLAPGTYTLVISWKDLQGGGYYLRTLSYTLSTAQTDSLQGSDVLLTENYSYDRSLLRPLLGNTVANRYETLGFYAEVYSRQSMPVTLRTILYQKNPKAEDTGTQQYLSKEQFSETIFLTTGENALADELDTRSLGSGEYLLELALLADDRVLWRRRRPFLLIWAGLDSALAQHDADARLRLLQPEPTTDLWELLALRWSLSPLALQAAYYQRLHQADTRYHGWYTDQGRLLAYLAEPYEAQPGTWLYPQWNLVFAFDKTGSLRANPYGGL